MIETAVQFVMLASAGYLLVKLGMKIIREACPGCDETKLALDPEPLTGATAFRCAACSSRFGRSNGVLIERAAFQAGSREPFPRAVVKE